MRHSGIDLDFIKERLTTDKFKSEYEKIKEQCRDKYVIGSVDRLSPLSGVIEKLEGYEKFLEKHPESRKNLILIQVCLLLKSSVCTSFTPTGSSSSPSPKSKSSKKISKPHTKNTHN